MKVSIIGGGGLVGSMTAFALQCGGVASHICLIDANKDMAAGLIGALVPALVAVAAGIASGFILSQPEPAVCSGMHPKAHLLLVVWLPSAVVILVTGIVALAVLRRRSPAPDAKPASRVEHRSEAFTERSPSWDK